MFEVGKTWKCLSSQRIDSEIDEKNRDVMLRAWAHSRDINLKWELWKERNVVFDFLLIGHLTFLATSDVYILRRENIRWGIPSVRIQRTIFRSYESESHLRFQSNPRREKRREKGKHEVTSMAWRPKMHFQAERNLETWSSEKKDYSDKVSLYEYIPSSGSFLGHTALYNLNPLSVRLTFDQNCARSD